MGLFDKIKSAFGKIKAKISPKKVVMEKVELTKPFPLDKTTPQRIGKLIKQETGEKLKSRLIAFAQKYSIDYQLLEKIRKMKPENILLMYINMEILFETYFDYETLEHGPYGSYAGDKKNAEIKDFVDAYESRFGPL